MPTKIANPEEFGRLKQQYNVGPSNFDQYFTRQGKDIYLNDNLPSQQASPYPFSVSPLPSAQEATNIAYTSPQYTNNAGIIDQEQNLLNQQYGLQRQQTQQTAANTREDLIRSYQDALDAINYQAKQVGIGVKAGSAQRQLYDASGQLSGIGQGVATQAIQPLTEQTRKLVESKGIQLSRLDQNTQNQLSQIDLQVAQLPIESKKQKQSILDQIVSGLIDSAQKAQDREFNFKSDQYTTQQKQQYEQMVAEQKRQQDLYDYEIKKQLDLKYKPTSTTDSWKTSYNSDLTNYKNLGLVQSDAGAPGTITRERVIQDLANAYPEQNPVDIAKDVYKFFPSKAEIAKGISPFGFVIGGGNG